MAEESIQRRSTRSGKRFVKSVLADMKALNKAEEKSNWEKVDDIRESLEDCLDVRVTKKLDILISTGGPASKIVYDIETEEAEYYFQDWFKPWTKANLNYKEQEALKEYVQSTFSYYLEECESSAW